MSMKVTLVSSMADDLNVVRSAKVSTIGKDSMTTESSQGLINYLMREGHASPFEHNVFTFLIQAPIFVAREFMRHRIASYNEESGRYRVLNTEFYYPVNRPLKQIGKTGDYEFEMAEELRESVFEEFDRAYGVAEETYHRLIDMGIAKEVARMVLPVGIYTSFYVTINARSLMNFLKLRTASNAQYEIRVIANDMEKHFKDTMPLTYKSWVENGRKAI